MPNHWFDQDSSEIAILKSEEFQELIAKWKKLNPGMRLPFGMQQIWDEEEARNAKKCSA